MIHVIEAAELVRKENESFGYLAGKTEIANDIWHSHLTSAQRLEVMNASVIDGLSALEALRKCLRTIASMF